MVKIKLITVGIMPRGFDLDRITSWKSDIFSLDGNIENYEFRLSSDLAGWGFSDKNISNLVQTSDEANFTMILVNVPLEENYYSRRISNKCVVCTFYEIRQYLENDNIRITNAVLRALYAYSLLYTEYHQRIPIHSENYNFTHHETRGCLFDMTGNKEEIIESCASPIICSECQERLKLQRVANNTIQTASTEIAKIRKDLYYRVIGFVKAHPLCSLLLSTLFATSLGILSSLIATAINSRYFHN